jgi:YwiC-like protein
MTRRLRPLLLPAEHGAWAFVLEPLVLGLIVAPSPAAFWIALATLAVFFGRQPTKLALTDLSRGQRYPRTILSGRLAIAFGTLAVLAALAAWQASSHPWWGPLVLAVPLGMLQLLHDIRREGRGLVPELAGPLAASASAPIIAAAAGWAAPDWLALWALVAAQAVAATVYVRARLRLAKGEAIGRLAPLVAHVTAIALAAALARRGLAPWLAIGAFTLLAVRAGAGLAPTRRHVPARTIGFTEVAWGAIFVALLAAGYRVG